MLLAFVTLLGISLVAAFSDAMPKRIESDEAMPSRRPSRMAQADFDRVQYLEFGFRDFIFSIGLRQWTNLGELL
jgi:hypothetical protein